jgi:hypothetical protein
MAKKKDEGIPAKPAVNFMQIAEDLAVGTRLMSAASAKWDTCKSDENARLFVFACGEMRRCMTLAEKATREGVFIPASFSPDEVALAE